MPDRKASEVRRGISRTTLATRRLRRFEPPQMVCNRFVGQEFVELSAFFRRELVLEPVEAPMRRRRRCGIGHDGILPRPRLSDSFLLAAARTSPLGILKSSLAVSENSGRGVPNPSAGQFPLPTSCPAH